ncbi:MAG: mechanosensitive ion channel family protein [Bacteroidota bacterium]
MRQLKNIFSVLILIVLFLVKNYQEALRLPNIPYSVGLIINFLFFVVTINFVKRLLLFTYRKRKQIPERKKDNVINGLENIYYLIVAGGVFFTFIGFWGIDARSLFTSLSIVAAAIAIVTKDYLVEIISGIIISFSNEISIDDYVKIGEQKGKIIDINLTKIALLNEDDDVVFMPNNKVYTSEIINYTKREIRKVNIDFEMDLKFMKSVEELEKDLVACLDDYKNQIEQDKFNLKIVHINKESLTMKFQYQLLEIDRNLEREIRKKTVRRVIDYIKTAKEIVPTETASLTDSQE